MVPSGATFQVSVPSWGRASARYGWGLLWSSRMARSALKMRLDRIKETPAFCPSARGETVLGSALTAATRIRAGWAGLFEADGWEPLELVEGAQAVARHTRTSGMD